MIDKKIFSERLKALRQRNNKTQVDIAKVLDINKVSVFQWESMKTIPTADKLSELANYFAVPVDYLLGNGLFADFDWIVKIREGLITKLEEVFGSAASPLLRGINIVDPETGNIRLFKLSDIDFVVFLSSIMEKIDFTFDEEGEPIDITLTFK